MTAAALARGTTCEVGGTRAFATPVNSGGSSLNELLTEMRMQREEQLLIMVPILGNRFFMLACLQAARLLGSSKGRERRLARTWHMATTQRRAGRGAYRVTTYSVMKFTSELSHAHTRSLVAGQCHEGGKCQEAVSQGD